MVVNCVGDGTVGVNNAAVILGGVASYGTLRYYIVEKADNKISVGAAGDVLEGDEVYMRKRYNNVIEVYILRQ